MKVLDVAGLIPGASEGLGLGNKFLDDLRHASILLHIIDTSGKTNEKGEQTSGYDPLQDVKWLEKEIHSWIFNNMWKRWGSIVRKHIANRNTIANTLQVQLSGYGTRLDTVITMLDNLHIHDPVEIDQWGEEKVSEVVWEFLRVRFPTILVLNKIDVETSDANIARICTEYPNTPVVLCSAGAEIYLRKMKKQGYIRYGINDDNFVTADEDQEEIGSGSGSSSSEGAAKAPLKPLDDANRQRLNKIRDMLMFRYGGTGVHSAINLAVEHLGFFPVYVVNNVNNFTCDHSGGGVFRDCELVPKGTTVLDLLKKITHTSDIASRFTSAENARGVQMGLDEELTRENNIVRFVLQAYDSK